MIDEKTQKFIRLNTICITLLALIIWITCIHVRNYKNLQAQVYIEETNLRAYNILSDMYKSKNKTIPTYKEFKQTNQ